MKYFNPLALTLLLFNVLSIQAQAPIAQEEWISLFDGKTFKGWHQYNGDDIPEQWSIVDETMVFTPGNYVKGEPGKNIVTDATFGSFVLSIEWKIAKKGNSGIFWAIQEDQAYREPYLTGPEIQVLDNERHPDAFIKPKYHQAGALYDMVEPTVDVCKPAEQWNHVLLTVDHKKNKGSVVLNGTLIVEFPAHGPAWEKMIAASKFGNPKAPDYTFAPKFGQFKSGKIGLQDHGDVVAFRNIKIKKL